jgi:hypothetical protein
VDENARAGYFDSQYHSAEIVGLNTSAFLEGAIVGRPVFTTLLPEHHENQQGTIHFHYLLTVAGGLLHTAGSLEEHFEQLNATLGVRSSESARSRRFVEAFIRPHGLEVAATPIFADAVETLSRMLVTAAARESIARRLLRLALTPAAALFAVDALAPIVASERDRGIAARRRDRRVRAERAWLEKRAHQAAEERRKEERIAAREQYKARRAAEWRRTKMTRQLTRRIKERFGLGS